MQIDEYVFLWWKNIIDMVLMVNTNGNIIISNNSFQEILGLSEGEDVGLVFLDFIHPEDVIRVKKEMISKLLNNQHVRDFEFRIINRQGTIIDVECNALCIIKENKLLGYQIVLRDIRKRKSLERDLIESMQNLQNAKSSTILGLAKLAEFRDEDTGAHLERIRQYSRILAEELSNHPKCKNFITDEYIEDIYQSAILHDIGKVGISDTILLKPGKLTDEEFNMMKHHAHYGGEVLSDIEEKIENRTFLTLAKHIAYYHHEKWNGTGYENGLEGENISLSARIVALADVYDALTSKRTYKDAFSHEKARSIIISDRGRHFDPDVVDAFLDREDDFDKIRCSSQQ